MGAYIDPEHIEQELLNLSRNPFRKLLAKLLQCADDISEDEMLAFGKKCPDRLWQSAAICARLAGYTEKSEVAVDIPLQRRIQAMSDSDLWAYQEQLEKEMARLRGQQEKPLEAGPPKKDNGAAKTA